MKHFRHSAIHPLQGSSAFTLVEITLSIAIMAIGIVAVLGIMPALLRTNRQSVECSRLSIIAQEKMDSETSFQDTTAQLLAVLGTSSSGLVDYDGFIFSNKTEFVNVPDISLEDYTARDFRMQSYNPNATVNDPLVVGIRVTYYWPPGSPRAEKYTFYTERAAKTSIELPDPAP